jgi:methyl-accepting chemotaxis protein
MITEMLLFSAHMTIVGMATLISIYILWHRNSPLRMYALIIPSLIYMTFLGFLIGRLGVYNLTVMVVTCLAAILGLVINFALISTYQTNPIWAALQGLAARTRDIYANSRAMEEASDAMSHSSAIQSATMEETGSSLAEVLSMTRQNTDKTKQMNTLVDDTTKIVSRTNTFMKDLTHSMEDINRASEETSKIVKTIDEIAFQTNLLALNAAVEAARAGASGAGFAVVAGEVRNLAMRSAEAAKNTAVLIEDTVKKIKAVTDLVNKTNQEFTEVAARSSEIGTMIADINSVSQKQERGIEQINSSIQNADQTIEQNIAHADELSALVEDTTHQAEMIRRYVRRMAPLVGWKKSAVSPVEQISGRSPEQSLTAQSRRRIDETPPSRALPVPKK